MCIWKPAPRAEVAPLVTIILITEATSAIFAAHQAPPAARRERLRLDAEVSLTSCHRASFLDTPAIPGGAKFLVLLVPYAHVLLAVR
jgi:hypothetical protein